MRLIDADALIHELKNSHYPGEPDVNAGIGIAIGKVWDAPTIEPERKNGKWQWLSSTYDRTPCELRYQCSECHHETIFHSSQMSKPWEKYCPHCGADMREGD